MIHPAAKLLILRSVDFFWRPSFGSAKRPLSPAGKFQNREALSFQCIPQTPLRPSPPWPHNFAAPIASLYPLATVSPPIRRTMLPNSRRVRWLSASSSLGAEPSFTMIGTISSPAAGSVHHQPNNAINRRPPKKNRRECGTAKAVDRTGLTQMIEPSRRLCPVRNPEIALRKGRRNDFR